MSHSNRRDFLKTLGVGAIVLEVDPTQRSFVNTAEAAVVTSGFDLAALRQALLAEHNKYRTKHKAPALTLYEPLNTSAQNHAVSMATSNSLVQSSATVDGQPVGPNIGFVGSSVTDLQTNANAKAIGLMTNWYNESSIPSAYPYGSSSPPNSSRHFTQMVWKASLKVGFGAAIYSGGTSGKLFLACHYLVAGNLLGLFPTNVLAP